MTDPTAGTTADYKRESLSMVPWISYSSLTMRTSNSTANWRQKENGRWSCSKDKFRYIWEDDTFTKNGALDYTFTLNGNGQPEDPEKGQCENTTSSSQAPSPSSKVSILKCVTYRKRDFSLFSTAASSRPRKMRWPQSKAPAIIIQPHRFQHGQ